MATAATLYLNTALLCLNFLQKRRENRLLPTKIYNLIERLSMDNFFYLNFLFSSNSFIFSEIKAKLDDIALE
jgi:hypothetical protein